MGSGWCSHVLKVLELKRSSCIALISFDYLQCLGVGGLLAGLGFWALTIFDAAIVVTQYIDSPWRLNWPYGEVFPQY